MAGAGGSAGIATGATAGRAPRGLEPYRAKRDFQRSPEPDGGGAPPRGCDPCVQRWSALPPGARFCIQLHQARRRHFDLRLERGGVLLSWAVPRGPGRAGERRLAVQVEDHPLQYGAFEGVIASGYGAGTVLLWDLGTVEWAGAAADDVDGALQRGRVEFRLSGQRLSGEYVLVRRGGRGRRSERDWLLIRRAGGEDRAVPDTSAVTGRSIEEVAGSGSAPGGSAPARGSRTGSPTRGVRPADDLQSRPMLATLTDRPFRDPGWLFELKYDGVRAVVRTGPAGTTVTGRSGRDETLRYPEIAEVGTAVAGHTALIDGEIVALDTDGAPAFSRLQPRMQLGPADAEIASLREPVVLFAFDLLEADGEDLRGRPLAERKRRLREILRDGRVVRYASHVRGDGTGLFAVVRERGLEGIVAKRMDSPYRAGARSRDWLKIKVRPTQDCVVCGYTEGRGSRRLDLGALVLGVQDGGRLVPAGRVGTGFAASVRAQLRSELDRRRVATPPLRVTAAESRGVTWARPELVCEVEHAGWSRAGRLRQPSFRELRRDLPTSACVREPVAGVPATPPRHRGEGVPRAAATSPSGPPVTSSLRRLAALPAEGGVLRVDDREVRVTNLDKPLWPADRITKRDLIAYHLRMARWILPGLRGRAVVLHVFPDGIDRAGFWRKNRPAGSPSWVRAWPSTAGAAVTYTRVEEPAALVWAANIGAIGLHPWHSRTDRPEQPDWAVFDLDPGPGTSLGVVIEVAQLVRAGLDHLGLTAVCKTSGQAGLQIYVPIRRGPSQDEVREWVRRFAAAVERSAPERVTSAWARARRGPRVRIDTTQNVVGRTLVAAYTPRPRPGGPVSTPIRWDELDGVVPGRHTIASVPARVRRVGDLFAVALAGRQRLPRLDGDLEAALPAPPGRR